MKDLEAIVATTTAIEYIDRPYCTAHRIKIFNTANYTGNSVAEFAVGAMFMAARHMLDVNIQIRSGDFKCFEYMGIELSGRVAGVVGQGAIGSRICSLLAGIGMEVLHHTRTHRGGSGYVDLDTLLKKSDVVFLAVPLNAHFHR